VLFILQILQKNIFSRYPWITPYNRVSLFITERWSIVATGYLGITGKWLNVLGGPVMSDELIVVLFQQQLINKGIVSRDFCVWFIRQTAPPDPSRHFDFNTIIEDLFDFKCDPPVYSLTGRLDSPVYSPPGVSTPRYIHLQGVSTPRCIHHRGVTNSTPWRSHHRGIGQFRVVLRACHGL
jgi:hypothetical protein